MGVYLLENQRVQKNSYLNINKIKMNNKNRTLPVCLIGISGRMGSG
jgi:hypothetical protein